MTTQVDTPSSRLPAPATEGNWKHRLKLPSGRIEGIVGAGVLVWLVAVPFLVNGFGTSILTQMLAFAMLASSLHILMGWTGIVSLGQAAYFGVAGYAVGLTALHLTTNVLVLLTVGMVAGGVAAASTGWLIVRRGGPYLLMLTLAFGELLSAAANSWASLTGGYNGLAAVPAFTLGSYSFDGPAENYWLVLVVFVSVYVLLAVLARSPFAKTLNGIRDNESKMRALGYSTRLFKYAVFCLSGAVAGMAGMAWVSQTRFISPADLNMHASSLVLLAVAVGGMRRQWGPCIGAVLIVAAQQLLPASIEGKGPLMLGVLLIVVVYLLPGGAASVPGRVATFFGRTR